MINLTKYSWTKVLTKIITDLGRTMELRPGLKGFLAEVSAEGMVW